MKGDTKIYDVMNSVNLYDNFPTIYRVCYDLYYKGKVSKHLMNQFNQLQSQDMRKFYYVPEELLTKVKSFIS